MEEMLLDWQRIWRKKQMNCLYNLLTIFASHASDQIWWHCFADKYFVFETQQEWNKAKESFYKKVFSGLLHFPPYSESSQVPYLNTGIQISKANIVAWRQQPWGGIKLQSICCNKIYFVQLLCSMLYVVLFTKHLAGTKKNIAAYFTPAL